MYRLALVLLVCLSLVACQGASENESQTLQGVKKPSPIDTTPVIINPPVPPIVQPIDTTVKDTTDTLPQ